MSETYDRSGISLDLALDLIGDTYRRRLLVALLEHDPQNDENPQVPADVTVADESLESVRIAMTHNHLPKLEDADVIEWDRETNTVSKGPRFDGIRSLLELMRNHADELPDGWL